MSFKSKHITESSDDYIYDYYEIYDEEFRNILTKMINGDRTPIRLSKIKPAMYQQALNEFMKYGQFMRYPTKYVDEWKDIIVRNTILLSVITMLFGHTSYFDFDTFNDMVLNTDETGESVSDWVKAMEYIEEHGYDDVLEAFLPKFSNGSDLISDYGLKPLEKIVSQLLRTTDPNEIIVLINQALDISHQRSDLSELFIEGGQASLNKISGMDENLNRIINEEISRFINEQII